MRFHYPGAEEVPALIEREGSRQDFTEGSIPRHLINFSIPMFLGNLLQALYNTVDSIWVGKFLGTESLAAVSVSFPIIFAILALVSGLSLAATTLVAQYAGARDAGMVKKTIGNSFVLLGILGIVSSVAGVVFRVQILRLINTPPAILDLASSYLGVFLSGSLVTFAYNIVSAVLRGLGDSRTPLVFLAYATVLNIVLDPIMIFGVGPIPRMGVTGAALATVIAQALSAVLGVRHLLRAGLLDTDRDSWKLDRHLTKLTFSIGLPAGIQQVIVSLGMLTLTSIVNRFGPVVVASFGVGGRLDQFAFMPAMTVGLSVTALVGQNLGAQKYDRVKEVTRWSVLLTVGITGIVSFLAVAFPKVLLELFTSSPEVLAEGSVYLRTMGLAYIPYGLMFTLSGVLRGAGDTFPSMLISVVTLWLVRIPLASYLSKLLGSRGIWIALAASPVVGAALNWLYYVSGRWKAKVVTRPGPDAGREVSAARDSTL